MALLLIDEVLQDLTPGLGHQAALLLTVGLTDLARLGDTLLLSDDLTVRAEHSLTLGLTHHLAVSLVDGAALLLVDSPTLRLTDRPAGLLVHCSTQTRHNIQTYWIKDQEIPVEQAGSLTVSQTSSYTAVHTGEEDLVQCSFVTGEHSFLCMMVQTWLSTVWQTGSHSGSLKHLLFSRSSAATFTSWQPSPPGPSCAAVMTAVTISHLSSSDTFRVNPGLEMTCSDLSVLTSLGCGSVGPG